MESKEFMSLVEAAMSVVINEDHMKGKEVIVFGKRGMVIKEVGSDGDTENDEIYQVKFEDGTVKNVPARDMEMQSDKREHSENELEDITNESVELGEAINRGNEAFWKEIHIELKKVMDNKYYREFRSSNGGQALDNVISHFGKARGWRVDRVVKEIIDKYGRNRDEYIKLSFAMAARSKIRESVELDEAQKREFEKGDVVVGRRGNFKGTEAVVVSIDPSGGRIVVSIMSKRKVRVDPSDWNKHPTGKRIRESVELLDEAWTADSVIKNAKIGSKKGYGINIKRTGGITKTPYKHMLMTMRRDKSVRVTFDHGKNEFEGTPKSVANYLNKLLGIKESVELDEAKSFRDYTTPASPQTKKLIESGKAKILKQVTSVLGDTTKFVVIENPTGAWHTGGNQDKVLMATISDPKRGRIKMFAFHGSHISIAKAMQFAINNKLVVTTKMESVEHLDELGLGTLVKYATAAQTQPNRARGFKKALEKINKRKAEIISGTSSLDEEPFVFPDEEKAKQFDLDIGNSAIGTGNNRVGNTVTVTGITSRWRRAAVKKAMLKSKGRFIKDSVEHLDEGLVLASDDLNAVKKTAQKLAKQSPDLTYYVVKHNERYMKGMKYAYYEVYQSVDMHLVRNKAKKIAGYGAKVDMRESVELDEANHDQRAADKSLFNAMKVVDPKARWKMVKTDPSRFGVDVEITSQKMAKYGDWTLMAWSDGRLMWVWYDHPNGEGSIPEREFKRVAKDMMKESAVLDKPTKGARQLKNPKTEVMMVDKKGKVIVIDRKDLKSYERKGWIIAESVEHLDENGVEAAHKGSCEEIHPDMPHEHWEKKKKSAYNVPNAMELLKKFNLKGKGRDVPAINNDEWGTPGFTTEGRNRERGDYVVGRRGNFEGEELVVHTDNPNEKHMTVRVPREGGKDRLVRVARTNFNKVSNGYKKRRFPGPKPR